MRLRRAAKGLKEKKGTKRCPCLPKGMPDLNCRENKEKVKTT